jgi:hypothetical protein
MYETQDRLWNAYSSLVTHSGSQRRIDKEWFGRWPRSMWGISRETVPRPNHNKGKQGWREGLADGIPGGEGVIFKVGGVVQPSMKADIRQRAEIVCNTAQLEYARDRVYRAHGTGTLTASVLEPIQAHQTGCITGRPSYRLAVAAEFCPH